ncbi:BMP family ABC transporter substrate-binding protein [Thiomonas sp. FB-Cd]|uniref:BMP family ABC transporter substrate-binding protein n=1 Tax=Thiomonas sp. FB-Cd TaxID=1158292 RepID=UPI0004DED10F|nr:BMP family ABC transporter substrate-binding protein [Thiomonas sp. FB-Cd]
MKHRIVVLGTLIGLGLALASRPALADIAVGYVYVGAKTDGGYNQAQDAGRLYVQAQVPGVKTNELENIPENNQVVQGMERMIGAGDKVIFATSYGYLPYALELAKKYPAVTFMHCGGAKLAPNLGTYFADMFEAMYLSGIAAGKASVDGKIGFVAAHPIPQILQDINAIELGAQSVNPKATVTVVYTGAWNDPAKDVAAVNTLVDQGVKVIGMHVDSPIPVIEAAKKRGVKVIGYHFDDMKFDPQGWLTGGYWNWGPIMASVVKQVEAGTWKSQAIYGNLASGAAKLAPFGPSVDASTRKLVLDKQKEIEAGTLNVWAGPIYGQDGKLVVAAGHVLPRPKVDAMNFFVKGVVGTLK